MEMQQHHHQTTSAAVKGKRTKRPRPSLTTSSTSTSSTTTTAEEEDMAHCLILLAHGHPLQDSYHCKTCNRSFPSFQALGGHRASHRKPKPPPPPPPPSDDHTHRPTTDADRNAVGLSLQIACIPSNTLSAPPNSRLTKVHACGICGAEFSSGQALGGHMRRHRSVAAAEAKASSPPRKVLCLDLNLPADEQEEEQSPELMFGSNGKTMMFASSLVDCRY